MPQAQPSRRVPSVGILRFRLVGNSINLSNFFGLGVAKLGGCRIRFGPRGLILADHYGLPFPVAGAFTIGNVIITARDWDDLEKRSPSLLLHEEAHTWQWLYCGGFPFLITYTAAMGWSVLRTGDRAAGNFFERQAGLGLGGYRDLPTRSPAAAFRSWRTRKANHWEAKKMPEARTPW